MRFEPKITLLLSVLVTISLFSCDFRRTEKIHCDYIKTGQFIAEFEDGTQNHILRDSVTQIESYRHEYSEVKVAYDIEWVDDCEYLLFNRKIHEGHDIFPEKNNDTLKVVVMRVWSDSIKVMKIWSRSDNSWSTETMRVLE